MNKVITINLNGNAYQLEEGGYDALHQYLANAARQLAANPDRAEIIADIEQAIADKFRALLGPHKTVVASPEVAKVIAEMGPVQDASAPEGESAGTAAAADQSPGSAATPGPDAGPSFARPKRLYKIKEGAKLCGVCNGLAAYLNVDVTIIRLCFVLLLLMWCTGVMAYLILAFILPSAETSAEMAAATGIPYTAEEFVRRAKAGYYEGMKTFHDKDAHREWRRNFKREMRDWKRDFKWQMHTHADEWRRNWHQWWTPPAARTAGSEFTLAVIALARWLLALVTFCAVVSLLADGTVFGRALPGDLHGILGLLFLFILYKFLAWPLKAARRACWHYAPPHPHPFGAVYFLWIGLLWAATLVFAFWMVNHHSVELQQALGNIPDAIHETAYSLKHWWNHR